MLYAVLFGNVISICLTVASRLHCKGQTTRIDSMRGINGAVACGGDNEDREGGPFDEAGRSVSSVLADMSELFDDDSDDIDLLPGRWSVIGSASAASRIRCGV
jgi:hypothetical protein